MNLMIVQTFSSAGWAIHISWPKCCLAVCLCLGVNQGDTNRNRCTQRLACTDLLTNPAYTKTRSVWPTLRVKSARRKKWTCTFSSQSLTAHGMFVYLSSASAVIFWLHRLQTCLLVYMKTLHIIAGAQELSRDFAGWHLSLPEW